MASGGSNTVMSGGGASGGVGGAGEGVTAHAGGMQLQQEQEQEQQQADLDHDHDHDHAFALASEEKNAAAAAKGGNDVASHDQLTSPAEDGRDGGSVCVAKESKGKEGLECKEESGLIDGEANEQLLVAAHAAGVQVVDSMPAFPRPLKRVRVSPRAVVMPSVRRGGGGGGGGGRNTNQPALLRIANNVTTTDSPGGSGTPPSGRIRGNSPKPRSLALNSLQHASRKISAASPRVLPYDDPHVTAAKLSFGSAAADVARRAVETLLTPKQWAAAFAAAEEQKHQLKQQPFFLSAVEISILCDAAAAAFEAEPSCLKLKAPIKVFGDLHGQYADLLRLFDAYGSPSRGAPDGDAGVIDYLFLGDYVDRGKQSLEVVVLLFALKVLMPATVYLLRGNHETASVNAMMGLRHECMERIATQMPFPADYSTTSSDTSSSGDDESPPHAHAQVTGSAGLAFLTPTLRHAVRTSAFSGGGYSGVFGDSPASRAWASINRAFDFLPLAATIDHRILCVHGGLGAGVDKIEQIDAIERPLDPDDGSEHSDILVDLLWSDPTANDAIHGIGANPSRGPGVHTFGPDRVRSFCAANNIDMILRGHECVMDGVEFRAGCRLITVFSATDYCGQTGNAGALLLVGRDLCVTPHIIRPLVGPPMIRPSSPPTPRVPLSETASFFGANNGHQYAPQQQEVAADAE